MCATIDAPQQLGHTQILSAVVLTEYSPGGADAVVVNSRLNTPGDFHFPMCQSRQGIRKSNAGQLWMCSSSWSILTTLKNCIRPGRSGQVWQLSMRNVMRSQDGRLISPGGAWRVAKLSVDETATRNRGKLFFSTLKSNPCSVLAHNTVVPEKRTALTDCCTHIRLKPRLRLSAQSSLRN